MVQFHLWEAIYSLPFALEEQLKLEIAPVAEMGPIMLDSRVVSKDSKMNDFLKLCFPLSYLYP